MSPTHVPEQRCMSSDQRKMVIAALKEAFDRELRFDGVDAIEEYLKDIVGELDINANIREIFDCYLCVTTRASGDGETRAERPAIICVSDDAVAVSFYRPRFRDFKVLTATFCKGPTSYISSDVVRSHLLFACEHTTVLEWSDVSIRDKIWTYTRCTIVGKEDLPCDAEVVLAENHGTCDTEDFTIIEAEGTSVKRIAPIHTLDVLPRGAATLGSDVLEITRHLNVITAKHLAKMRRKALEEEHTSSSDSLRDQKII